MRQSRALGPDINTFPCAWLEQSLLSLCNNPPMGSFHSLSSSLLASRAVLLEERAGSSPSPCKVADWPLAPCKSNSFSPVCHAGETAENAQTAKATRKQRKG